MALNFPANPQDGDTYEGYEYDSTIGAWIVPPPEAVDKDYVDSAVASKISTSEKGSQFGVAELDGDAKVEITQLDNIVDSAPNNLNTIGKIAKRFNTFTTAEWAASTEILPFGSINSETDVSTGTVRHKIGNGLDVWNDLPYVLDEAYLDVRLEPVNEEINLKANVAGDTFSGTLVANSDFIVNGAATIQNVDTIAGVTGEEIEYLSGVTSPIQGQLDDKVGIDAIDGLAPLDSPTFTGTVSLPYSTSIGNITQEQIDTLDGISTLMSIQDQLDDLQDNIDLKVSSDSPTFTGTVSGITSTMVGLGNVDNTSDANKPISSATQDALDLKADQEDLDAKASLSGATFTGPVFLDADPTQALEAVTKQYVDSVEAGLITRPQVRAATTANLANVTYANGTSGTGATITSNTNGAFPLIDGVQLTTVNGNRGLLVKNQTNAAHNGRYNLTTQGTESTPWVLTRCGLCDNANEIPGSYIFVTDGTVNGQTGWVQHVDDPATFVVGTDNITVFQFAGAGSVTAGTNISVSGNQVSVINSPVFSGIVNASAAGVQYSDGTQTKAGVPSASTFVYRTASYTLDALSLADNIIEVDSTSATTVTIPLDSSVNYPVGTSIDILQTNTGQVTIAATGGVTMNGTPGFKLRTRWSSATILKRASNSWLVYGDLMA
jgi:hypothetical protein